MYAKRTVTAASCFVIIVHITAILDLMRPAFAGLKD
jgi:hypothetical protein